MKRREFVLSEALAAAPASGSKPFPIHVPAGEWRERNFVTKPNIHLIGEGQKSSVLVFNTRANADQSEDLPRATLVVRAPGFRASNLTIANDFDYPGNQPAEVPYDRTGASGAQATALKLDTGSDRAVFDDVAIISWQDTLYTDAGRSYFKGCFISGCVDFIYGRGTALFDRCDILSRTRTGKAFHGFIAAPDTDRLQKFGLIFLDCKLH
jgi:pectinesterase